MRLLLALLLVVGLSACSSVSNLGPEPDGGIGGTGVLAIETLQGPEAV